MTLIKATQLKRTRSPRRLKKHVRKLLNHILMYEIRIILINGLSSGQWHLGHVCISRLCITNALIGWFCSQAVTKLDRGLPHDLREDS